MHIRNVVPVQVVEEVEDPDHGQQGKVELPHEALLVGKPLIIGHVNLGSFGLQFKAILPITELIGVDVVGRGLEGVLMDIELVFGHFKAHLESD